MGKKYTNPPVTEAVCEFRFDPTSAWDLAIPGLIYERLRQDYPKRHATSSVPVGQLLGPLPPLLPESVQFSRSDDSALVRISPHQIAIIHLRPYGTWDRFMPMIEEALTAYREAAEPKGIQRVGLRYVNHILLRGTRIELEDYFNLYPFTGASVPHDYFSFLVKLQTLFENRRDVLTLQLFNASTEEQAAVSVQLDLDYFLGQAAAVTFDSVHDWLETAHLHVEETFEACVNDRLRAQFVEERS